MSCYEIYLFNVTLTAIIIIRTNYRMFQKISGQVGSEKQKH
jgi:hypothetical protein